MDGSSACALSVVIPVYNEAGSVGRVVRSWLEELDRLHINFELLVYDDGSRDGTADVLTTLAAAEPRLSVKSHTNRGHGPTILAGYRDATGEWVFQVDSDDEMSPASFESLWSRRMEFDLLLGCRQNRHSPLARRALSAGSRVVVGMLFGAGLWDVNTPYRLIRRASLISMLSRIRHDTFAPNVIIAGLAVRQRLRVFQCWVPHRTRRTGTSSVAGLKQWKTAIRCTIETLRVALRSRTSPPSTIPLEHGVR